MINLFKIIFVYILKGTCPALLHILKYILGIHEMYDKAVQREPYTLDGVHNNF